MQCKCGHKAVYFRRYSGQHLCSKCFSRSIFKKFKDIIRMNKLMERGDRIVCGVSGGKDSLVLLYLLKKLSEKFQFELSALTIDEGISGYRDLSIPFVKKACSDLDIELHIRSFKEEYGYSLDEVASMDDRLGACSYCGVFRRNILNKHARELGADRLAMGHNLDDESQVILMNLLRGDVSRFGRMGTFYRDVHHKFIPRIKPLREIPEKEIVLYAIVNGIDFDFEECPYAPEAFRDDIRDFLNMMEEKRPGTKHALLKTYDRLYPLLNQTFAPESISTCGNCGEPSISLFCKKCEMLEDIGKKLGKAD
ncbi:MAG: TIGR00269 family protein [Candidatus Methanofastidiosa archaeon]|nr:TIGR00269 family protein [Candidatus Methanofastidiosa archaeon]